MRRTTGEAGPESYINRLTAAITALGQDIQALVRLEIDLAKTELQELARRNAAAVGMLVASLLALLFLFIFFQVWLIVLIPHHAIVAGCFTLFWLIAAAVLALVGKARLKIEAPKATIESLKEDVEWLKQQLKNAPK